MALRCEDTRLRATVRIWRGWSTTRAGTLCVATACNARQVLWRGYGRLRSHASMARRRRGAAEAALSVYCVQTRSSMASICSEWVDDCRTPKRSRERTDALAETAGIVSARLSCSAAYSKLTDHCKQRAHMRRLLSVSTPRRIKSAATAAADAQSEANWDDWQERAAVWNKATVARRAWHDRRQALWAVKMNARAAASRAARTKLVSPYRRWRRIRSLAAARERWSLAIATTEQDDHTPKRRCVARVERADRADLAICHLTRAWRRWRALLLAKSARQLRLLAAASMGRASRQQCVLRRLALHTAAKRARLLRLTAVASIAAARQTRHAFQMMAAGA